MLKTITLMLLFFITTIMANEVVNIDSQIAEIKNASPAQRVKLMNEFKMRVSQMNDQERSVAIQRMQMQNSSQMTNHQTMNQKQAANQFSNTTVNPPGKKNQR